MHDPDTTYLTTVAPAPTLVRVLVWVAKRAVYVAVLCYLAWLLLEPGR